MPSCSYGIRGALGPNRPCYGDISKTHGEKRMVQRQTYVSINVTSFLSARSIHLKHGNGKSLACRLYTLDYWTCIAGLDCNQAQLQVSQLLFSSIFTDVSSVYLFISLTGWWLGKNPSEKWWNSSIGMIRHKPKSYGKIKHGNQTTNQYSITTNV